MAAGLAGISLLLLPSLRGQAEPPPSDDKPLPAIRAWIFPAGQTDEVSVSLSAGNDEERRVLAKSSSGENAADEMYNDVPEQQLVAEVRIGDRVESSSAVTCKGGNSYTMVVWYGGGKWQSKLYLDSGNTKSADRDLRVFNFADGRSAFVGIDDAKKQEIPAASVVVMAVKPGVSMVNVEVADSKGGPAAKSAVEVDFQVFQNAYIVVAPDYRGRMRPRILPGGRTAESLKAEAALRDGASESAAPQ
jgi:hypothetical protein